MIYQWLAPHRCNWALFQLSSDVIHTKFSFQTHVRVWCETNGRETESGAREAACQIRNSVVTHMHTAQINVQWSDHEAGAPAHQIVNHQMHRNKKAHMHWKKGVMQCVMFLCMFAAAHQPHVRLSPFGQQLYSLQIFFFGFVIFAHRGAAQPTIQG